MAMNDVLWQDRDVRFDVTNQELQYGPGEEQFDRLDAVEDTKGNSGDKGKLFVTNLRIIWQSHSRPRVNLSVGFNCITGVSTRTVNSKLRGIAEALYLLTKTSSSRYEFIFTNLQSTGSPRLIASVVNVFKSYNSSKPYRELRLRAALLQRGQLIVLPGEHICSRVQGVWNLSSDQGNLGTFYISNVRLVWHANMNDSFNISLPYIQMSSIKTRESKFGTALVIETTESSGGYVLGFKVDPAERLQEVSRELSSLYKVHKARPVLGVDFCMEQHLKDQPYGETDQKGPTMEEDESQVITESHYDAFAAYLAEESKVKCRDVVYNTELGLAMEKLKEGYTLASLWEVVPP
ncbi:Bardet-Biedl syndrome 5 protein homolog [Ornithodoros turicata]|uniref:Bardet-Biedl syndrome 5 protein homolog n=1 Tax=Ornithodoros turicata TaxID=34597 RepID=UPI0031386B8C